MSNETTLTTLVTDAAKEKSDKLTQSYKELKNTFETGNPIDIEVLEKVKGGFKVSYKGISLFLPVALYTSKRNITDEELSTIVGKTIPVKIKDFADGEFGKVIKINHKEVVEEKLWNEIENNTQVEAKVKEIVQNKGVVVTLSNDLEAFIPLSHISRERIEDIANYIAVGEIVKGEIIELDKSSRRIIISLRNAPSKHLNAFFDSHNIGDRIKGKLKNITRNRAYFTIAPNIDGSIKMSEVFWTRRHIRFNDIFEADKEYEFEIINLDRDNQYIDLSYRKTQPNNWQEIANKYEIGYTYSAVVEFIPPNGRGAEVSINNEIDGFMPKQRSIALYNGNKPSFKANDVIQVKLIEKNAETHSFLFESALKQVNPYDMKQPVSVVGGKNISKPEVIKNFTLADLLSESSKQALK